MPQRVDTESTSRTAYLNNQIGGPNVTDANQIAYNAAAGVYIDSGTGNAILKNLIYGNGACIDLGSRCRGPGTRISLA